MADDVAPAISILNGDDDDDDCEGDKEEESVTEVVGGGGGGGGERMAGSPGGEGATSLSLSCRSVIRLDEVWSMISPWD